MAAEKQAVTAKNEKRIAPSGMRAPEETYNTYYMRVSEGYGIAKWAALLFFAAYLIIMLLLCRDSITYENMLYLMRDLNVAAGSDGAYSAVSYEEQQNMAFSVYRSELVVAGSSGLRMYDASGSAVFTDSTSYSSPVMEAGEKYLLLYDAGGTEYSLFTTLTCVNRGKTEGAIQCAAVCDNGSYALVVRCSESKYMVCLYNAEFREIARYYRDSYITDAAFSEDGSRLAVLASVSDGLDITSTLTFCDVGAEHTESISLGSLLPLRARYLRGGNLAVVCDEALMLFSPQGERLMQYTFSSMTLSCFDISSGCIALACSSNILGSSGRLLLLDGDGEILCDTVCEGKVASVTASDTEDALYAVYGGFVERLEGTTGVREAYSGHLLALREISGHALLCFSDGARAATLES